MTTFPILNRDLLKTDDQRDLWDEITKGPRGFYCGGPESKRLPDLYNAYMLFPELGRSSFRMADKLRQSKNLKGNWREIIVLTTSAILGARVEYDFHVPFARDEGVSEDVIKAIGEGKTPTFTDPAEKTIYDANVQFLKTATLTPETRDAAIKLLTHEGVMEMIACVIMSRG